jgi:superfamily I DNA/RNA helicase
MAWSVYQQGVFTWVSDHVARPGAIVVEAVAGSGKTTTIVEAANLIPTTHKACFLAFNKSIAEELGKRLPSTVESRTLNSLGFGVVRRQLGNVKVEAAKVYSIIDGLLKGSPLENSKEYARELNNLIGKAKSHAVVPDDPQYTGYKSSPERWAELAGRYDVDVPEDSAKFYNLAELVLRRNLEDKQNVDFDDMMYFVVALNMPTWKYDWLIVDEAQDVSHVQRMMLRKFLKNNGRLIAVGDRRQAIYGFRGADSSSLDNIAKEFGATVLPLSITYRCAQSIVEEAQRIVPFLQARDDAPQGVVRYADNFNPQDFVEEDLVICRYMAPVIESAFALLARRIPCRVEGRDIGVAMQNLVKRIAGRQFSTMSYDAFVPRLMEWLHKEVAKATAKRDDARVDSIHDKVDSIVAVADSVEAKTVSAVLDGFSEIFSSSRGVKFSTVHRAKGLEADRVFILEPQAMPSKRAKQEWQKEQEMNLLYVAITRAKSELVYLPKSALAAA